MSSTVENTRENLANFLKIYSNFAYFLLFSPYRYVRNSPTPSNPSPLFLARSWWPQRLLSAFSLLLGILWLLREIRLAVPKKEESRVPSKQFQVMLSLCGAMIKFLTIKRLWFHSYKLLDILNFIVHPDQPYKLPVLSDVKTAPRIQNKSYVICVCLLYTFISFINFATGRVLQSNKTLVPSGTLPTNLSSISLSLPVEDNMDNPNWWHRMVLTSQFNLFMDTQATNATMSTAKEYTLGILGAIGFFQRQIMGSFCDLFLLMGALTFWVATRSFAEILQASGISGITPSSNIPLEKYVASMMTKAQVLSISQISQGITSNIPISNSVVKWVTIEKYLKSLHILTKLLNSCFGNNLLLFLIESVVYYATTFDQVFFERGSLDNGAWAKQISLTFFFANACFILLVSADTAHQMNSLKEWLSMEENRNQVPADHIHVVLNELDYHVVALKGSGVFPVTYPLLANMLSITVTYFIICVQV